MSRRQYTLFLYLWHLIYLGGWAASLSISLWQGRDHLSWREAVLCGVVALLCALYVVTFVIRRQRTWPPPWWWLMGYFGGSLGLWFWAQRLQPEMGWAIWAYVGQMFGVLPPKVSIPSVALLLGSAFLYSFGWGKLQQEQINTMIGVGTSTAMFAILSVFMYLMSKTSAARAHLIAELEVARAALERAKAIDAELAMLRERERVARDLHDGLGHSLVGIGVELEAIQRLYRVDPDMGSQRLDGLKELTRRTMADVRSTLTGLRSQPMGPEPFTAALQTLTAAVQQRSGLMVRLSLSGAFDDLPAPMAETLWRVAQEALTNAEKHAQARHVTLGLHRGSHHVALTVTDDGVGIAADGGAKAGHFGIRGMSERAEGLGGLLTVEPAKPHGTSVKIELPLIGGN